MSILARNKRHAVVVRLGEKRILNNSLKSIRAKLEATKTKRKASDPEPRKDGVKGHRQKKHRS
jgi:SET domain-containing protein 6